MDILSFGPTGEQDDLIPGIGKLERMLHIIWESPTKLRPTTVCMYIYLAGSTEIMNKFALKVST